MTKESKLIQRIESLPYRSDITMQDFDKYLKINSFELVRQDATSHKQYKHKISGELMTVACHGKHVKVSYIKQAVEMVRRFKEEDI